ncbi:hypothetical protein A7982_12549 [Minicystis rosea]|nr:hypothetical protein A7982_12549 [Minicystis rosea]
MRAPVPHIGSVWISRDPHHHRATIDRPVRDGAHRGGSASFGVPVATMTTAPPPVWNHPGAGPPPPSPAKRLEALGTTCLVLSIAELIYCIYRLVSPLFSKAMLNAQRSFVRGSFPTSGVMEAAEHFMKTIAIWEALRTIPFVVATGFLLWIALRLRKGDGAALQSARTWALAALGVVVVSAAIQLFITVPATLEYQRTIANSVLAATPAGSATPPFDVKQVTSMVTMIATIAGLVMGTVFSAAWPIVLYVWAGKLAREVSAPVEAH